MTDPTPLTDDDLTAIEQRVLSWSSNVNSQRRVDGLSLIAEVRRLRAEVERQRDNFEMTLDAFRVHHVKFHPECNISGPQNPPKGSIGVS